MACMTPSEHIAWKVEPDLDPPMNRSVCRKGEGSWAMGSSMRCECLTGREKPEDAIATWKDAEGVEYCLLQQNPPFEPGELNDSNDEPAFIPIWKTAFFEIGKDVLVKVKYSSPEWPNIEGDVLQLLRSHTPDIPVPECLYSWMDSKYNRNFVIQRRLPGEPLATLWPKLSEDERVAIADELAAYQTTIARNLTATKYQGATGGPCTSTLFEIEDWPTTYYDPKAPRTLGPFTPDQLRDHIATISDGEDGPYAGPTFDPYLGYARIPGMPERLVAYMDSRRGVVEQRPVVGDTFHLFHNALGPRNVLISMGEYDGEGEREVRVSGLLNWEMASYVPDWWLTACPYDQPDYRLPMTDHQIMTEMDLGSHYMWKLNEAMIKQGWENGDNYFIWIKRFRQQQYTRFTRLFNQAKEQGLVKWLPKKTSPPTHPDSVNSVESLHNAQSPGNSEFVKKA